MPDTLRPPVTATSPKGKVYAVEVMLRQYPKAVVASVWQGLDSLNPVFQVARLIPPFVKMDPPWNHHETGWLERVSALAEKGAVRRVEEGDWMQGGEYEG